MRGALSSAANMEGIGMRVWLGRRRESHGATTEHQKKLVPSNQCSHAPSSHSSGSAHLHPGTSVETETHFKEAHGSVGWLQSPSSPRAETCRMWHRFKLSLTLLLGPLPQRMKCRGPEMEKVGGCLGDGGMEETMSRNYKQSGSVRSCLQVLSLCVLYSCWAQAFQCSPPGSRLDCVVDTD